MDLRYAHPGLTRFFPSDMPLCPVSITPNRRISRSGPKVGRLEPFRFSVPPYEWGFVAQDGSGGWNWAGRDWQTLSKTFLPSMEQVRGMLKEIRSVLRWSRPMLAIESMGAFAPGIPPRRAETPRRWHIPWLRTASCTFAKTSHFGVTIFGRRGMHSSLRSPEGSEGFFC